MYGYIYETTNLVNGKKYIGKHKSDKFDNQYLGSGIALKKSVQKYGKQNFSVKILEIIKSNQKELDEKEKEWIVKYNAVKDKMYYNRSYGGENEGWYGVNKAVKERGGLSQETKKRMSKSKTGNKHPMYGKKHSEKSKEKMSKIKKGKKTSLETRKKQSEALKGEKAYWYGKRLSKKTKEKLSKAHKDKNRNRRWINNKLINKYVLKEEVKDYLSKGWKLGMKNRKSIKRQI